MNTFVIDTSVLVKWYNQFDEQHTAQAQQILVDLETGKIQIIVPYLIVVELTNVLIKSKFLSNKAIESVLDDLFSLPIMLQEITQSMMKQTITIAEEHSLATYDALFLALAKQEKCKLISDDARGHGKVTDGSVVMLKDYR